MPHKLLDITKVVLPALGAAVEGLDLPLGVPTKSIQSAGSIELPMALPGQ